MGVVERAQPSRPPLVQWRPFDVRAFCPAGHAGPHRIEYGPLMEFRRGDPLQRVWSCFGGLGVYRMEAFRAARYSGGDSEHVSLHRTMRAAGYDRFFLNPSHITIY